jgi:hypothetical protein
MVLTRKGKRCRALVAPVPAQDVTKIQWGKGATYASLPIASGKHAGTECFRILHTKDLAFGTRIGVRAAGGLHEHICDAKLPVDASAKAG